MKFDKELLFSQVLQDADIEVFWEKPSTGESGFISSELYPNGAMRCSTGKSRLKRIPEAYHAEFEEALAKPGVLVQFPYKQEEWFDYQWFEQALIEERQDEDGETLRVYFARRIQQSKQLELMLEQALDTDRENIVEENLDTGQAKFLFKYSKNPSQVPAQAGERRKDQDPQFSVLLEEQGASVQFEAMLPGHSETDWIRQTNFRNFTNESGERIRWLLVKNITEQKQAELAQQRAYEQLRRSTQMGGVGIFTYDLSQDLFELDEISRKLLVLPLNQYPLVDSDKLLTYVVGTTAKQLRETISFHEQARGTQALELNVHGWDGIHRWVTLKFEFLDSSDGWLACGVLIDVSDTVRDRAKINQQLRQLEEQERVVDLVMDTAEMLLIEVDLDTGRGEIVRGRSPHEKLYRSFSVDKVQQLIHSKEDYQRLRVLRDRPGESSLVRTLDVTGNECLYWSLVGYTETYRREGRVYQMFYRRIVDDIERLAEEFNQSTTETVNRSPV